MAEVYKGWNVDVKKNGATIAQAQSISVEITANVDAVHGVGNLDAQELKQGPREISGSLERIYGDEDIWNMINPEGTTQTYATLTADMEGGSRTFDVKGVKFDSWSGDFPQDDFITESADFTATAITLSGTDASVSTLKVQSSEEQTLQSLEEGDEEEFECSVCSESFDSKQGLSSHKRVHKEEEGD